MPENTVSGYRERPEYTLAARLREALTAMALPAQQIAQIRDLLSETCDAAFADAREASLQSGRRFHEVLRSIGDDLTS